MNVTSENGSRSTREGSASVASLRPRQDVAPGQTRAISMIAGSQFENEVLSALLQHDFPDARIRRFDRASEWEKDAAGDPGGEIVLYNLGDAPISDPSVKESLQAFIGAAGRRKVIVISRSADAMAVFDAIDVGASSFIPASSGVEELLEAIRASSINSVVVPRSTMTALREVLGNRPRARPGLERYFTERQLDVAHALRRGAANKTIAYELGLCESTVKVHIRNIMRKLRATNRTQAAYRLNELHNGSEDVPMAKDEE